MREILAHRFALSLPVPVVRGASGFLPASTLESPPRGLATSRRPRRAMRPTDVCHLNLGVHPHSRVPGSLPRLSPRGGPTESQAPRGMTGGTGVSRHPNRFGGSTPDTKPRPPSRRSEHGHVAPMAPVSDRASDTSVASHPCAPVCAPSRASRSVSEPPRPASAPLREEWCFPRPEVPSIGRDPS